MACETPQVSKSFSKSTSGLEHISLCTRLLSRLRVEFTWVLEDRNGTEALQREAGGGVGLRHETVKQAMGIWSIRVPETPRHQDRTLRTNSSVCISLTWTKHTLTHGAKFWEQT